VFSSPEPINQFRIPMPAEMGIDGKESQLFIDNLFQNSAISTQKLPQ